MQKRAAEVLFAAAALYGFAALALKALFPSQAEALIANAVLSAIFLVGLLWAVRRAGLWAYDGLAWTLEIARRVVRNTIPFAPILVIPLLNLASAGSMAARPVAAVVTVLCGAVIEEVLLRGLTLPLLVSFAPKHVLAAVVTCAALFAALHLPQALATEASYGLAQIAVAFFLGIALGFMRVCTASVYPGIVAHILINVTANGPILYSGQSLWPWCLAAAAVSLWSYICWKRLRSSI